jgi:hypothetical protein
MPRRERTLRDSVCLALQPLNAIAVENPIIPGTPDVNYAEGWIELKSWEHWPRMASTALKMDHWTPYQRVWHIRRSRVGGRTYVLLEIVQGHHFLLLEGGAAARILGKSTRSQLEQAALALWEGKQAMKTGLLAILQEQNLKISIANLPRLSAHVPPLDPDTPVD